MEQRKIKLAVLVSGSGSNLQALIDACQTNNFPAEIVLVISNRPDAYALERAKTAGIDTRVVDHKKYDRRADFDEALANALAGYEVDLICLAGFMRILTPEFTKQWEGKMINTHPALLPKHGGEGMYGIHVHNAVLDSGDTESGVSIHYVIAECDAGDVVLQRKVPVLADDTPESLAERVLKEEHLAYPEAIKKVAKSLLAS